MNSKISEIELCSRVRFLLMGGRRVSIDLLSELRSVNPVAYMKIKQDCPVAEIISCLY